MRRLFFIALFFFALNLALLSVGSSASAAPDVQCFSTQETGASLYLEIRDNGFIVGDICVDDCGCGSILGEAHVLDLEGRKLGTLDFFADLPESCAFGIWYSIDLPSLTYIWFSTGLDSTRYSGTGEFKEVSCSFQ